MRSHCGRKRELLLRWQSRFVIPTLEESVQGASAGRFEALLQNLDTLKKSRDRYGSPLKIFVTSILMKQTVSEVKRFKRVFSPRCDGIYFTCLANPGGQVRGIEDQISRRNGAPGSPCRLLWSTMVVNFDGTVTVCCLDFNNQLVVGDIGEDTLLHIWHNGAYRRYRELHRQRRFTEMPLCGECNKEVNSPSRLVFMNLKATLA